MTCTVTRCLPSRACCEVCVVRGNVSVPASLLMLTVLLLLLVLAVVGAAVVVAAAAVAVKHGL